MASLYKQQSLEYQAKQKHVIVRNEAIPLLQGALEKGALTLNINRFSKHVLVRLFFIAGGLPRQHVPLWSETLPRNDDQITLITTSSSATPLSNTVSLPKHPGQFHFLWRDKTKSNR
jgi:hypothetical protein